MPDFEMPDARPTLNKSGVWYLVSGIFQNTKIGIFTLARYNGGFLVKL
jgi:hypothetical protein